MRSNTLPIEREKNLSPMAEKMFFENDSQKSPISQVSNMPVQHQHFMFETHSKINHNNPNMADNDMFDNRLDND